MEKLEELQAPKILLFAYKLVTLYSPECAKNRLVSVRNPEGCNRQATIRCGCIWGILKDLHMRRGQSKTQSMRKKLVFY